MKLWTVWQDYGATGEGRTLMARVAYAENEEEALAGFGRAFDLFFASGAKALEGVQENEVTQALFAPAAFQRARWKLARLSSLWPASTTTSPDFQGPLHQCPARRSTSGVGSAGVVLNWKEVARRGILEPTGLRTHLWQTRSWNWRRN